MSTSPKTTTPTFRQQDPNNPNRNFKSIIIFLVVLYAIGTLFNGLIATLFGLESSFLLPLSPFTSRVSSPRQQQQEDQQQQQKRETYQIQLPIPCQPCPNQPTTVHNTMSWFQKTFTLTPASRGSYLITDQVTSQLPEIRNYKVGLLNLFVQHTSCALSLNENWDEDVREDMSDALDRIAPEDRKGNLYRHSAEGLDDMPAHIKSALIGASVTVPIKDGKLATGTWQGIWYLEFRASKHSRKVVATIQGEKS